MALLDVAIWTAINALFLGAWILLIATTVRIGLQVRKHPHEVFQLRVFRLHVEVRKGLRRIMIGQVAGFLASAPAVIVLSLTPLPPDALPLVFWTFAWVVLWTSAVSLGNVWVARAFVGDRKSGGLVGLVSDGPVPDGPEPGVDRIG